VVGFDPLNEDVVRFEIAVNDSSYVDELDGIGELGQQPVSGTRDGLCR
jgi:hypothetical protein